MIFGQITENSRTKIREFVCIHLYNISLKGKDISVVIIIFFVEEHYINIFLKGIEL